MKKLIILTLAVFLISLGVVSAVLDINSPVDVPSPANLGQVVTVTFDVDDTGTNGVGYDSVDFVSTALTGPSGYSISAPSVSSDGALADGASTTHQFTVTIPSGASAVIAGVYTGTLNGTANLVGGGTSNDSMVYTVTVASQNILNVVEFTNTSAMELAAKEDDSDSKTFTVRNEGSTVLSNIVFTNDLDLTDDDGDSIALSFSPTSITTLNPGQSTLVTLTADIGSDVDVDNYDGTVFATSSGGTQDSFKLEIDVTPEVCKDGNVGDLSISIDNPDDDDEFEISEEMDIDVNVDNDGSDDISDVVVEAFLYDLDKAKKVETVESDPEDIDENDDIDYELKLTVPNDVDADNEFVLFIKAFEDGDEDDNCVQDSVTIEIDRPANEVIVDEITVLPSSVVCGSNIEINVDVLNVGDDDEDDVLVEVINDALGLSQKSSKFDLDKGGDSGDDASQKFTFTVPKGASGSYSIEGKVTFKNGRDTNSDFATLIVTCPTTTSTTPTTTTPSVQPTTQTTSPTGAATTRVSEFVPVTFADQLKKPQNMFWLIGDVVLVVIALVLLKVLFTPRRL
ncbi:MAG: putative S-layer protein [Candidatus Woesearchaeota archaeon]|nr:MAG: putative S-layer protein [Candidatus Woesearchaeota archaeon]